MSVTPPAPTPATVRVNLSDRSYDVVIGSGLLRTLGDRLAAMLGRRGRAFVVVDDRLPPPLLDHLLGSLTGAGFDVAEEPISAHEARKSMATVERIVTALASTKHERGEPVIALGGGIIGDTAGFAASVYRRGVPVVQCPTTLLAMVDAAIGGKTGVNLPTPGGLKKNMVGTFWQPLLVMADVDALRTLAEREFRAGLAECLKHGLVARSVGVETDLFAWTRARLGEIGAKALGAMIELVRRNAALKASVVAGDERETAPAESGGRALLNLGHTFAHAIETLPDVSAEGGLRAPLLHGEAVGLGLVAAAACANKMRLLSDADFGAIRAAVQGAGLPTRLTGLPPDEAIIEAMSHDKKVAGGALRLVLPTGIGEARVVERPPMDAVRAGIAAIRA